MNDTVNATPEATTDTAPVQRKRGRPVEADSALSKARALRQANPGITRAEFVTLATTEISGLSKSVAGTYFHLTGK